MIYTACPTIDPETTIFSPGRSWYHENINFKQRLVITAGDSWTWGDSLGIIDSHAGVLDSGSRATSIYGYLLASKLDADFINIGICGGSNINIHDYLKKVIDALKVSYTEIYVVITLTENYREASSDAIWVPNVSNTLENFLTVYEQNQFESFKVTLIETYKHINFLIARNFTYNFNGTSEILAPNFVTDTWVDQLSKYQNKLDYPENLRFMTTMSIVPLHECLQKLDLYKKFKLQFVDHYVAAEHAITWLEESSLNYKKATKHPTELGHQIWAEYLHQQINDKFKG